MSDLQWREIWSGQRIAAIIVGVWTTRSFQSCSYFCFLLFVSFDPRDSEKHYVECNPLHENHWRRLNRKGNVDSRRRSKRELFTRRRGNEILIGIQVTCNRIKELLHRAPSAWRYYCWRRFNWNEMRRKIRRLSYNKMKSFETKALKKAFCFSGKQGEKIHFEFYFPLHNSSISLKFYACGTSLYPLSLQMEIMEIALWWHSYLNAPTSSGGVEWSVLLESTRIK